MISITVGVLRLAAARRSACWRSYWQAGVLCLLASFNSKAVEPAFCVCGAESTKVAGSGELEALMGRLSWQSSAEDRREALASLQRLALSGDAEAAFRVGRFYQFGTGQPDYNQALIFYKMAIGKGHARALNNIGSMYESGLGVPADLATARAYFEESAQQGSEVGSHNLARLFLSGRGVPRDQGKAMEILEKCAQLKNSMCVYDEASLYLRGEYSFHEDYSKGLALAEQAASMGNQRAGWGLAKLYLSGEYDMPIDVPKGLSMLQALSDQGYGFATAALGDVRADPKLRSEFFTLRFGGPDETPDAVKAAVPQDVPKAETYWLAATQQGYCRAFASLASVYDRGAGVPVDYAKSAFYVAKAVQCAPNDAYFLFKLADRMTEAKGIPRDCIRAERLYYKSLSLGHIASGANLGYIYDKGCGSILRDDRRAFQIYLVCAKAGDAMCQNNVGAMLKHGRGVGDPDYVRAYGWLLLAASAGEDLARKNLENYKDLFQPETREQGMQHALEIEGMIHPGRADMQALDRGDMTY